MVTSSVTPSVTPFGGHTPGSGKMNMPYKSRLSVVSGATRAGSPFEGIWVPIITPFRDEQVDFEALQRLATDLVKKGIHGLVVCGTTGEASQLDADEQAAALDAVLEAVGSGYPVLMGISGSATGAVASKARSFSERDIAGFLVSAPSYVRPSQDGILLHFRAIADVTDRPIVLYNIPARTGVNIDLATVVALSEDPQFAAIKESSGNIAHMADMVNHTPLKVLSGDDALILATLCCGGHGAISAAAHIRPDLYVHAYNLMRSGHLEQARAVFNQLLPLIRLLFSEPNPAPIKAALAMQCLVSEDMRLPMTSISKSCRQKLAVALDRVTAISALPGLSGETPLESGFSGVR